MTPSRHTPFLALPPSLSGRFSAGHFADGLAHGLLSEIPLEAARPSALAALLLMTGSAPSADGMLSRVSDADVTMYRETLELLGRMEPTSAA